MSVSELRREMLALQHQIGGKSPSTLRKTEVQRLIPIYKEIIARRDATPLEKESHHLPPREIVESATSGAGVEIPVVPAKRLTIDRKKPATAKDIVIVHETGDAEAVEVKKGHVKKEKVVKEKVEKAPVEASAEPKKSGVRFMTDEHKAKMKAGREAMKAAKLAASGSPAPASPPASVSPAAPPAPSKLPSGVRPL
jgi:hypothetical protein